MPLPGAWKETTSNKIPLSELKNVKYAYIIAIDGAGNISQKQRIQLPTYKITVNPNGGTWKGANTNTEEAGYYNGQTIKIEPPTRQGYNFEGWEVTQGTMNGSKTEYTFTTSNATLKARWSLITPEVGNNLEEAVTANKMDENGTATLTKENGEISYRISYTTAITNYIGKAKIEIVSTLPTGINTDKSELAGGRYNQNTNTITWIEEIENINTFSNGNYIREIPKQITIVYENQDVTQDLINTVTGKTITYYPEGYQDKGGQEFIKAEKTSEVTVKQDYKVNFKAIANWEDNNNMKEKRPENVTIEIKVMPNNQSITKELNQESNWTYEEKGLPKYNAEGEKIAYEIVQKETQEGDLEYYEEAEIIKGETQNEETTNYTYTITNEYKLMNTDLNTEMRIEGTKEIQSREDEIGYTINLKSEIADYIGEGKIKIVDTLPYEIDLEKSNIGEGIYNEETKTITWEKELPHINTEETKQNYNIEETKQITLVYKDIDLTQEKMTNQIKGKIELYETEEKDEKTVSIDTAINVQGKVIVKYIDKDTNEEIIKITKTDDVGAGPVSAQNEKTSEPKTYGYEITGLVGDKYETEQKEIPYYVPVKSTENTKGELKEEDTVEYYYRKQNFNIGIEKEIESIQLNGEEIGITNKNLAKVEIKGKEIDQTNLIIKYNIKVTNKGEIGGTAKIEEQIPQGYKLVGESIARPIEWKQTKEGTLESDVNLEAGESKDLELTIKWENQEENLGTKISTAKIASTENPANYKDTNEKDDISEVTIVISIKTGEAVSSIIIMVIVLSLIICSYITIFTIRRKEPEIKDIRVLNK